MLRGRGHRMIYGAFNYLIILVAAAAGWLVGAVWYGLLANHWVSALGKSMEQFKQEQATLKGSAAAYMPFVLAFVANVVMGWIIAWLLSHFGPGQATVKNGVLIAVGAWLGFVVTTLSVNNAFAGRRTKLTLIDAGHWLAVLVVIGAIVGWRAVR